MPVTVYTKDGCPPCQGLKKWLQSKNVTYEEKNTTLNPKFIDEILARTGMRTFPQTFVGDKPVIGPNITLLTELLML